MKFFFDGRHADVRITYKHLQFTRRAVTFPSHRALIECSPRLRLRRIVGGIYRAAQSTMSTGGPTKIRRTRSKCHYYCRRYFQKKTGQNICD
jgi:hypothetical protein